MVLRLGPRETILGVVPALARAALQLDPAQLEQCLGHRLTASNVAALQKWAYGQFSPPPPPGI
jgi:hypothetical protein